MLVRRKVLLSIGVLEKGMANKPKNPDRIQAGFSKALIYKYFSLNFICPDDRGTQTNR